VVRAWVTGACLGVALVCMGWRTPSAVARWVLATGAFWVTTAAVTAASFAAPHARGGMARGSGLRELIDATTDVFGQALLPTVRSPAFVLWPIVLALLAAASIEIARIVNRPAVGTPAA
jgi:hypothetical protein